jgi:hypothetical protein
VAREDFELALGGCAVRLKDSVRETRGVFGTAGRLSASRSLANSAIQLLKTGKNRTAASNLSGGVPFGIENTRL